MLASKQSSELAEKLSVLLCLSLENLKTFEDAIACGWFLSLSRLIHKETHRMIRRVCDLLDAPHRDLGLSAFVVRDALRVAELEFVGELGLR